MKTTNFTIEKRNKLINLIFQQRIIVAQLSNDLDKTSDDEKLQNHLMLEYEKALNELQTVENEYTLILPKIELSRCPFSKEIYTLSIDSFGLNGPWWDANQPIRTFEKESKTFFALTGSVNIKGELPDAPFPIKPGPAVPWVSPRLLSNKNITAVLSAIKIDIYNAYVVVYFSKDKTIEIERINTWGTDGYIAEDIEGIAVLGSTFDEEDEYDFDITPWIEKGKLKWIFPNDDALELQDSVDNCPYLGIKGYQYPVLIQNKTIKSCMLKLEYDDDDDDERKSKNFCTNCGAPVIKGAKFCGNCGNKLN
ncbi:hypothetical protein Lupro_07085 [Lutibacter profundi]|uniref:Zinc-ribbon domain-containing protein n=1 Tax=Lutibacter profundi TaxID=1622118 RepID=A0A0X8G6P4_9FLAO|nr:zinc ribbon domain-containing protein [Lutibacter profundi]AMC11024.1 hypothetical protein Lupro_07085 [Lutibacter profundi]